MKGEKKNPFETSSIFSLVLKLAIPAMLSQAVSVLYSIVDRMFIGHIPEIGDLALAGVGICSPITTLISSFGYWVGIGGSILMGMHLGNKDKKNAEKILWNSFVLLSIFSIVLTLLFLIFKKKLFMIFGGSPQTFPYGDEYLSVFVAGTIFSLMSIGLNLFITGQGFSYVGMATICIGAISNIILDAIFILVFEWGVKGAAFATVLSQLFSALFALCFLLSKRSTVRIRIQPLCGRFCRRILSLGISPFLILGTDSIIILLINFSLQHYGGLEGDTLISAMTIGISFLTLITGPLLGISSGTQAILSYFYGANEKQKIRDSEKIIVLFAFVWTTVMFIVSQTTPHGFVLFFTKEAAIQKLAVQAIKTMSLAIIPLAFQYVFVDALTALGRVKTALCLSMFRKFTFALLILFLPLFGKATYTFFGEPIADLTSAIVSTITFFAIFEKHLKARDQLQSF